MLYNLRLAVAVFICGVSPVGGLNLLWPCSLCLTDGFLNIAAKSLLPFTWLNYFSWSGIRYCNEWPYELSEFCRCLPPMRCNDLSAYIWSSFSYSCWSNLPLIKRIIVPNKRYILLNSCWCQQAVHLFVFFELLFWLSFDQAWSIAATDKTRAEICRSREF